MDQDIHLLGLTLTIGRPVIIAANKIDLLDKDMKLELENNIKRKTRFAQYLEPHFISAKKGTGVKKLLKKAQKAYNTSIKELDTSILNDTPKMPVIDEDIHTAFTPLGYSLRVAGTAEFAGFNEDIHQKRIDYLYKTLESIYPSITSNLDLDKGALWYGFRPMSPDGMPYIGPTKLSGLFVNTGHGHSGWTLAMGSGDVLADLMLKKQPKIEVKPFLASRAV